MNENISECTFKFILERNRVLVLCERYFALFHRTALFVLFKFWATRRFVRWSLIYGLSFRSNAVRFERYRNQLWYLNRHVHAYVKMGDLAKIDHNAERLEIDIEKGNSLDHHRITRAKKKGIANGKCAKTTRVCMDDGLPANSVVTEKLTFREHFGAQLAGTVLPFKIVVG